MEFSKRLQVKLHAQMQTARNRVRPERDEQLVNQLVRRTKHDLRRSAIQTALVRSESSESAAEPL